MTSIMSYDSRLLKFTIKSSNSELKTDIIQDICLSSMPYDSRLLKFTIKILIQS